MVANQLKHLQSALCLKQLPVNQRQLPLLPAPKLQLQTSKPPPLQCRQSRLPPPPTLMQPVTKRVHLDERNI